MEGGPLLPARRTAATRRGLTLPVAEYGHDTSGCTVIGGYVYRGAAQPALAGGYLFGDYCSGTIWAIDPTATSSASRPSSSDSRSHASASFGEDEAGELYLTDASAGRLWRVEATQR